MANDPNRYFGRFKAERVLGIGATGRVWLATDGEESVAVKVMRDEKRRERFHAEISKMQECSGHLGVPDLVDVDPEEELVCHGVRFGSITP